MSKKKKKITINTKPKETETPEEEAPETEEGPVAEVVEEGPSELEKLQQEMSDLRKRLQREKQDSVQFANERLIRALIPIFENLERALAANDTNIDSLKEGVQLTSNQVQALFKKENVETIQSIGEPFDPSIHEVLSQIESPDHDENTVIEEYSKGYRLNGRVLLPARVVTSKKPQSKEPEDQDSDNASTEAEAPA